ncbi:MAG: diguanylate cyclase [Pseudomonadales bacterium]
MLILLYSTLNSAKISLIGSVQAAEPSIALSDEERAYLAEKKVIRMCVDPDWMPFEQIDDQGQHNGMAAEYLKLFAKSAQLNLVLYPTQSWQHSLDAVRTRQCDILSLARETKARKVYLDFTEPYVSYPIVMATTLDKFFISDITQELDKRFAIVKGYSVINYLKTTYPQIDILEVDNIAHGLELVNSQQVYAYIDSLLPISYAIKQNDLLNLKISGEIDFDSSPSVATRNDEPLLRSIFQKAIDNVSPTQKQEVYEHWVSVRYEQGRDYRLLLQVSAIALILLIGVLTWNRKLATANKIAQDALDKFAQAQAQLEQKNLELERLAITDKLTGLYNRIKLDRAIDDNIGVAQQHNTPFGIMLLDVDHFKQVNDHFGHQTGDQVLIELAQLLTDCARAEDIAARWGGEEFILLCPDTDARGMMTLAHRVHQLIAKHEFAEVGNCTVSVGASVYREGDNRDHLIGRADKALYHVKKSGRNRVEMG